MRVIMTGNQVTKVGELLTVYGTDSEIGVVSLLTKHDLDNYGPGWKHDSFNIGVQASYAGRPGWHITEFDRDGNAIRTFTGGLD